MQKILDYIKNGKGVGARFILVLAIFVALYSAYGFSDVLPKIVPHVQSFTDTFFPIKIENGKVIAPQNTVIEKTYHINGEPIVIKLDTTQDLLDNNQQPVGIYLTRSYLYSVSDQKVERQNLPQEIDLKKQDYVPVLQALAKHIVWAVALIGPFFNFICFMLAVLFYAWLTSLACALNKLTLPFKTKMRLNTCLFVSVYIFSTLVGIIGWNLSLFSFFLIMLALQIVYVKKVGA